MPFEVPSAVRQAKRATSSEQNTKLSKPSRIMRMYVYECEQGRDLFPFGRTPCRRSHALKSTNAYSYLEKPLYQVKHRLGGIQGHLSRPPPRNPLAVLCRYVI